MLGTGAGTFAIYWVDSGEEIAHAGALDAHSLYLETLAELGPVGLTLLAVMLLAPLAAAIGRRTSPYVPAAAGAYVAFLVHAGLDWDWEMPAVVVAALACAAALLLSGDAPERPVPRALRIAVLVLALVLGGCAIAGARSHAVPAAVAASDEEGPAARGLRSLQLNDRRLGVMPVPLAVPAALVVAVSVRSRCCSLVDVIVVRRGCHDHG